MRVEKDTLDNANIYVESDRYYGIYTSTAQDRMQIKETLFQIQVLSHDI